MPLKNSKTLGGGVLRHRTPSDVILLYHGTASHRRKPSEPGLLWHVLDMWGCRTVQAPMPDKEELLGDTRSVTVQEHKWYRSVIGMMCYYAVQTGWDIAFEVNRAAQFPESSTQGALAAAMRITAYLVGTWDKKWWFHRVQGNT